MDGGTLKFILEAGGATVRTMDGPDSKFQSGPDSRTLHARIERTGTGLGVVDLSIFSETTDTDTTWLVDEGDDCGMNHDDIVNLVLHCHGE